MTIVVVTSEWTAILGVSCGSESDDGPIALTQYPHFESLREEFAAEGISLPMPTGK